MPRVSQQRRRRPSVRHLAGLGLDVADRVAEVEVEMPDARLADGWIGEQRRRAPGLPSVRVMRPRTDAVTAAGMGLTRPAQLRTFGLLPIDDEAI